MKDVTTNQSKPETITQNTKEVRLEKERANAIRKLAKLIDDIDKLKAEYEAMQAPDYYANQN